MILTQGEKMVWAAAFVAELSATCASLEGDRKLRRTTAVMRGMQAVDQARIALREMDSEGYEEIRHDAVQMLRAMLGDEG